VNKSILKNIFPLAFLIIFLLKFELFSQTIKLSKQDISEIKLLIQQFKKDERGPYQAIRWFCPDGTIIPPKERCQQPGGIQHALHKDVVQKIAKEKDIYLGQILAGTIFEDFLDIGENNSLMIQYQMEKYLQAVDDGWIMKRARYYRGAIQAEDEEAWGINFLNWLIADDRIISSQFFIFRQIVKDIPHLSNNDNLHISPEKEDVFRSSLERFINLNKIHGIKTLFVLEANSIEATPGELKMHEVMRNVGIKNKIAVINLHEYLKMNYDTGLLWWDSVHMTSYGHALTAKYLSGKIINTLKKS